MMSAGTGKTLISVDPEELRFHVELGHPSYCDLKVSNQTEQYVAFKVKTTSPKKYFVRPNTGVVHPLDSCIIRVTLQAQREYPPDMQCRDKFLLQSTIVSPNGNLDNLPPDTFNKENGKVLEERKLRVVYLSPISARGSSQDESLNRPNRSLENLQDNASIEDNRALQQLKEERDAAIQQTKQLQQELEMIKRLRHRRRDPDFSSKFALFVGFIGIILGFLLKLMFSSPSTTV
ncbi:hypothetical protein Droror1_Dr00012080 [Drosera rotundifolia]